MSVKTDPRTASPDLVYKDFNIYNPETTVKLASKNITYSSPIIDKANDYYVAIARFSISHMSIPLYFFGESPSTKYWVEFNGNREFLVYQTAGYYSDFGYENPVFYYHQFAGMVNAALSLTNPSAPFIQYSSISEKFSLYFNGDTVAIDTTVTFSGDLFRQLQFIQAVRNADDSYTVTFEDYQAGLNYYENQDPATSGTIPFLYYMEQERPALYLLNQVQNIAFISNRIPTTKEYVPNFTPDKENVLSSRSILCDFIPNLGGGRDLSEYQYYPQGPLRLINMESEKPITAIDVQLYFVTKDGTYYPLYLEQGEGITIKFIFMKKSLANSAYSSLLSDKLNKY